MPNEKPNEYVQRNKILKMLSDDEVARVSRAETADTLTTGDEYVDLKHLDRGVQSAGKSLPMNNLVPKKAVLAATWLEIVSSLTSSHS